MDDYRIHLNNEKKFSVFILRSIKIGCINAMYIMQRGLKRLIKELMHRIK